MRKQLIVAAKLAGKGELAQPQTGDGGVKVNLAVNAFTCSRNAEPALKQAGYDTVINTEIESQVEMGPHTEGWQYLSISVFLMYVCQITSVFYFSISVFYFSILTELHPIIQY